MSNKQKYTVLVAVIKYIFKTVEVEAENESEAEDKAVDMYYEEDITYTLDDFTQADFDLSTRVINLD